MQQPPIRGVPIEILCRICEDLTASTPITLVEPDYTHLIGKVCYGWRCISRSHAKLWSNIRIQLDSFISSRWRVHLLRSLLLRSGQAPLRIAIVCDKNYTIPRAPSIPGEHGVATIICELIPHSERIHEATLVINTTSASTYALFNVSSLRTRSLVTLDQPKRLAHRESMQSIFLGAEQLVSLTTWFPTRMYGVQCHRLTELSILSDESPGRRLHALLQVCTSLCSLRFDGTAMKSG